VVSAPAITRLYSPSDVGAYSVASSILSVLIVVTCLRYEWAIPLPESDVAAANVVALCLLVAIGTSLIAGLALWIVGGSLLALLGASALGQWVVLIAVGQLGAGVVLALTGWAIRTKSFAEIGVNRLTQSGTLVAVQVVLGVLRLGPVGMLLGSVAGNMAGSGRLASTAWRTHAPAFRSVTWHIGPFVLIALLAPILAGLVFGDAWRDTRFFVAVLAPMFYLQLVTSPTGGTLDVLERQDLHLVREILRLIFVGGAALISAATHSAPMVAVGIFSVAGCLTYIAYGLASWRAITSHGSG